MRFINILLVFIVAYFLVLVQSVSSFRFGALLSFFPLFVFVSALAFFEKSYEKYAFTAAIVCGFSLDMYSVHPFGFYIILLPASVYAIKFIVKKYVGISQFT